MNAWDTRRWRRSTWLIAAVVLAGLIGRQFERDSIGGYGSSGAHTELFVSGWPWSHCFTRETSLLFSPGSLIAIDREWSFRRIAANLILAGILFVAAVWASETLRSCPRRFQFGLGDLLTVTAVVALFFSIGRAWEYWHATQEGWFYSWSPVTPNDLLRPWRWPSLAALVCAAFALVRLVTALVGATWIRLRKRTVTSP